MTHNFQSVALSDAEKTTGKPMRVWCAGTPWYTSAHQVKLSDACADLNGTPGSYYCPACVIELRERSN